MKKKRLLVTCLAGVLLLYSCAYGWVRYDHHIVHSVVVDAYGNYSDHSVVAGDAMLAGGWFNSVLSTLFTPLRGIECCYWHLRHPEGTELSETHRRNRRLGLNRFSHMQDPAPSTSCKPRHQCIETPLHRPPTRMDSWLPKVVETSLGADQHVPCQP